MFLKKYQVLVLTISFLIAACAGAAQPTPSAISPTPIPSTPTSQPTFTHQPTSSPEPTLTPLPAIELKIELPVGDAERGYLKAIRRRCHGCHVSEEHPESGPRFVAFDDLPNIFERGEIRIADPAYKGRASTNREYVIESILVPEAYFVPGNWNEPMPIPTYNIITEQELADIISWMETLE